MEKISRKPQDLQSGSDYDVIVVGTGYGGAIAASRMARAGLHVCVLERGDEILPGSYPDTLSGIQQEMQISGKGLPGGNPKGMFDLHLNEDVNVLVGCGLGGTSLINANVALEPDQRLLEFDEKDGEVVATGPRWPTEFRKDPATLEHFMILARQWLGTVTHPDPESLNKYNALRKSADAMGVPCGPAPINVNFRTQVNSHGVYQPECNGCGDCCSGCNRGSKNTTLMNYLPDAHLFGAEIYRLITVDSIEKTCESVTESRWTVHYRPTEHADKPQASISANIVMLAAGTLGSSGILLRSQDKGLPLSDRIGDYFSGNGDVLAFGYNAYWKDLKPDRKPGSANTDPAPVYSIGQGNKNLAARKMPGPCITGVIDIRNAAVLDPRKGLVIEDGTPPGAFNTFFPAFFFSSAAQTVQFMQYGQEQAKQRLEDVRNLGEAVERGGRSLGDWSYKGPLSRTMSYLVMSVDDAGGCLSLEDNGIRLTWPGAGQQATIEHDNAMIKRATAAIEGQFIPNPVWDRAFGYQLFSVHPLGGCVMGDNVSLGVVNHVGQVFDPQSSNAESEAVHEGLFVCDGSVIPGAIGVNPLLTISGLAERTCQWMSDQHLCPPFDTDPKSRPVDQAQTVVSNPEAESIPTATLGSRVSKHIANFFEWVRGWILWLIAYCIHWLSTRWPDRFPLTLVFDECMQGYICHTATPSSESPQRRVSDRFALGYKRGKADDISLTIDLTIGIVNPAQLAKSSQRKFKIDQCVVNCSELHNKAIKVSETGTFELLKVDASAVETWLMVYNIPLTVEQKNYNFKGTKYLRKCEGSSWWTDLTTLYTDVNTQTDTVDNNSANRTDRLSGIVSLDISSFAKQLASFRITSRSQCLAKFLQRHEEIRGYLLQMLAFDLAGFFGQTVFSAYGGLLADLSNKPEDRPSLDHYRQLECPAPETETVLTTDGAKIQLTRYSYAKASNKPPVLLVPGLGVRASSFATPTVRRNLVEYLVNGDFDGEPRDVWLFDYRASADTGSSTTPFSIDDIASYDWPAALSAITEKTGVDQVQVIAHCVGSMTALLHLLETPRIEQKIHSIVCSQLTLHPIVNWFNYLKADTDIVTALAKMTDIGNTIDVAGYDAALDTAAYYLPVPAGQECTNPTCHRVFSVYGPSYTHSQLNDATHNSMHNWFGPISSEPFKQLSLMMRKGYAVDSSGANRYLTNKNLPNLKLPVRFLAGSENLEFLPETSRRTYEWLVAHNGASYYKREIFPGYAHMDMFIGKNAYKDGNVFPRIAELLNEMSGEASAPDTE